jgi:hypothetical protein
MTVHAAKGLEWPSSRSRAWPAAPSGGAAVFPAGRRPAPRGRPTSGCCPFPAARRPRRPARALHGLEPEDVTAHLAAVAARDARRSAAGLRRRDPGRATAAVLGLPLGGGRDRRGPSVFLDEARAACLDGAGEVALWVEEPPEVNPVVGSGRTAAWPSTAPPGRAGRPGGSGPRPRAAGRLDDGPLDDLVLRRRRRRSSTAGTTTSGASPRRRPAAGPVARRRCCPRCCR